MKTIKGIVYLRPKLLVEISFLIFVLALSSQGTVIEVPIDQPTIQAAIDASTNLDTVLVAPGVYFENIRYFGKSIVVASHFIMDNNPEHIFNTIIDGSAPPDPDSASVVKIIDHEDSTAQLTGFTIRNGTGTQWPDPHGFGDYREGGGILCEFTSPTISFNRIINNVAIDMSGGMVSAGGGGIRCGDGNPKIICNLIMNNRGRYGAGIVLNFATGVIKNNIVAYNSGGEDFGGRESGNIRERTVLSKTIPLSTTRVKSPAAVFTWGPRQPLFATTFSGGTPRIRLRKSA